MPLSAPGPANLREPLWEPSSSARPLMRLGCGLGELLLPQDQQEQQGGSREGGVTRGNSQGFSSGRDNDGASTWPSSSGGQNGWVEAQAGVQALLDLYSQEEHVLIWHGGEARVALKEGAGPRAVLRALWQVQWWYPDEIPSVKLLSISLRL